MKKMRLPAEDEPVLIELPGLKAVMVDSRRGIVAVDGISGTPTVRGHIEWRVLDLRDGTYGDFHRLTPADICNDRDCANSGQHVLDEALVSAVPADTAVRYALVEQMGHRATYAAVRETTFCGEPMLEVTDLRTGTVHTVSPKSLYEVSWLTEDEARSRAKPWTATAITTGSTRDDQGDADPWLGDEDDPDDQDAPSVPDRGAAENAL